MKKGYKILTIALFVLFFISIEVLRLHYTIEAVTVSKELKIQKEKNNNLQKEISREKMKLGEKMELNKIKERAKKEVNMEVIKNIHYIEISKDVLKQNK
ncbi:MAG: hypothetical protein KAH04_01850 [Psychrilyobacter sp.]|nr:hypothetical protein [Psychrilyobacter sp.]